MNVQSLLNEFAGAKSANQDFSAVTPGTSTQQGGMLQGLAKGLPGGLAGGVAAGGVMALLMGNKKARKFAGKAAGYGGAAVLGGIAYSAYKNWKGNDAATAIATGNNAAPLSHRTSYSEARDFQHPPQENQSAEFQLTLVKAMIAAAKADGHIDAEEQKRIFDAVDKMALDPHTKGFVFDLLRQPIYAEELAHRVYSLEQKSEVYLASCLTINPDHPSEQEHLGKLAQVLALPPGLAEQLRAEAYRALEDQAA